MILCSSFLRSIPDSSYYWKLTLLPINALFSPIGCAWMNGRHCKEMMVVRPVSSLHFSQYLLIDEDLISLLDSRTSHYQFARSDLRRSTEEHPGRANTYIPSGILRMSGKLKSGGGVCRSVSFIPSTVPVVYVTSHVLKIL